MVGAERVPAQASLEVAHSPPLVSGGLAGAAACAAVLALVVVVHGAAVAAALQWAAELVLVAAVRAAVVALLEGCHMWRLVAAVVCGACMQASLTAAAADVVL